jgi:hypothetical protein
MKLIKLNKITFPRNLSNDICKNVKSLIPSLLLLEQNKLVRLPTVLQSGVLG